jgi:uncharacterized protein (TIGR02246 family)
MARGWADGDADAFAAVFAEECDFTTVRGEKPPGRVGIAMGHDRLFRTAYYATRLRVRIESLRYLRPDLALVNAATTVIAHDDTELVSTHALAVVERAAADPGQNAWQITAFHNMLPIPAPDGTPAPRSAKEA